MNLAWYSKLLQLLVGEMTIFVHIDYRRTAF